MKTYEADGAPLTRGPVPDATPVAPATPLPAPEPDPDPIAPHNPTPEGRRP